jgi:hypothetical protein
MNKKKDNIVEQFITLTVIKANIKKETKEKLLGLFNKPFDSIEPIKDSYGRDAEFYKELGVEPPEEFTIEYEDEEFEENTFEIGKDDYEIVERTGKFRPEVISFIVDNQDTGSTLYIRTDFTITVKETAEEVEQKIKLVQTQKEN